MRHRGLNMPTFGQTIRQLRLAKGLSQKSVYQDIVSRSFATRFERGDNDISATKLFAILDNLGVTANEFRFIHQGNQPSGLERALTTTERYYAAQNFPALADWIQAHRTSPHTYDRLVASYNTIRLITFDHADVQLNSTTRPAYDHLQAAPSWTLRELPLAQLLIPIVAANDGLTALPALTHKMTTSCARYQASPQLAAQANDALLSYYGSLFQTELNFHAYSSARALKEPLLAVDVHQLTWDGRLTQQVWLGIWHLYFGDWTTGEALVNAVLVLETRYHPHIDNPLFAIVRLRTTQAHQYRQNNHNS